jgi:hypothetical protein
MLAVVLKGKYIKNYEKLLKIIKNLILGRTLEIESKIGSVLKLKIHFKLMESFVYKIRKCR